jgi:hypothetical protein
MKNVRSLILMRFLYANRDLPRIECRAGFRSKALSNSAKR